MTGNYRGPYGYDRIAAGMEARDETLASYRGDCPFFLQNGEMGRHGINTCNHGCWEQPECGESEADYGPPPEGWEGWTPIRAGKVDPLAPTCDGRCLTAADVGVTGYAGLIAYPDPPTSTPPRRIGVGVPCSPTTNGSNHDP